VRVTRLKLYRPFLKLAAASCCAFSLGVLSDDALASELNANSMQNVTETNVNLSPQTNVISQNQFNWFSLRIAQPYSDFISRKPNSDEVVDILFSPTTSNFSVLSASGDIISVLDPVELLNSSNVLEALSRGNEEGQRLFRGLCGWLGFRSFACGTRCCAVG